MPQASSAVRPTNGLYLLPFTYLLTYLFIRAFISSFISLPFIYSCFHFRTISFIPFLTFIYLQIHFFIRNSLFHSIIMCRSQWPRGLRCRSSAARLLRLLVRIPTGSWMFVCCEWCVLSGRGLCNGLITRPDETYWLWCVVVSDQETSKTRRLKPANGLWKYNHNGL